MKKKIALLAVLAVLIIAAAAGIWVWYKNSQTTDNSLANIEKKGTLVVGSNIPFGILEFFDGNNNPAGLDVDIAKEIASRLGVKLEFNNYDWDQLFVKVKNSEIDLAISGITITADRQKEVLFSDHYFHGGQVIVVRSDNRAIEGVVDLAGKRIAVQKDTTSYDEARKYTAAESIFPYLDFDSSVSGSGIINDLKSGKFDVIIVDYIQALDMIKSNSGLKIVGVPFTKETYGIITRLGNNSLVLKINAILSEMEKDGTLDQINAKWIKF